MIVLDFETYYDKEYSLRRMTPVEYILDPRFECIGCAIIDKRFTEKAFWLDGQQLLDYISALRNSQEQGARYTVASHNALFDMCILNWHFGFIPDLIIDTLAMARATVFAITGSVGLANVAAHFGLEAKIGGALQAGFTRQMYIDAGLYPALKEYARHDAELCLQVFHHLAKVFPKSEYKVVDMITRCAVQPQFKLDPYLLAEHKFSIAQNKERLLTQCGLSDRTDLMSNDKFADALRVLGVEPPTKTSLTTGKETYAFAKTDPAMAELSDHPDDRVQALVAARVGHKSTLEETRTDRLLKISQLEWPNGQRGLAPIPLRYSGAHTHRLSGDWKLNAQNWPRTTLDAEGKKTPGILRRAHRAPDGHVVVKCDASQIEARIVAWLAGQNDLVDAFRNKRDIYSEFATDEIYHYPVGKDTPDERFVGKGTILGCGFGMGPDKFRNSIRASSYINLGRSINISQELATSAVYGYRRKYKKIPEAWKQLQELIPVLAGESYSTYFGPVNICQGYIGLPNGLYLQYPDLEFKKNDEGKGEWVCYYGKKPKKIFGGKLFENIVQALARIIVTDAAIRMKCEWPEYNLAHYVHDDLVYIVKEEDAGNFRDELEATMSFAPLWAQGLPLDVESGVGPNYGDAK